VVDLALGPPPGESTHWTGRELAKAAGVSLRSVQTHPGSSPTRAFGRDRIAGSHRAAARGAREESRGTRCNPGTNKAQPPPPVWRPTIEMADNYHHSKKGHR